jgi:transcription initiation factor IIF auxiliary subunit
MNLALHNSWNYEGNDRWAWSAYLKGNDLNKVRYVDYILHTSFKRPVRTITEPEDGFRMDTAGWGSFELKAIAHCADGHKELLTHMVLLKRDPQTGNTET